MKLKFIVPFAYIAVIKCEVKFKDETFIMSRFYFMSAGALKVEAADRSITESCSLVSAQFESSLTRRFKR